MRKAGMTSVAAGSASMKAKGRSIDLSKSKEQDEKEGSDYGADDDGDEDAEDQFEAAGRVAKTTWADGGNGKNKVLNILVTKFGMIIQKKALDDEIMDDADEQPLHAIFSKLPSASRAVLKLKK